MWLSWEIWTYLIITLSVGTSSSILLWPYRSDTVHIFTNPYQGWYILDLIVSNTSPWTITDHRVNFSVSTAPPRSDKKKTVMFMITLTLVLRGCTLYLWTTTSVTSLGLETLDYVAEVSSLLYMKQLICWFPKLIIISSNNYPKWFLSHHQV